MDEEELNQAGAKPKSLDERPGSTRRDPFGFPAPSFRLPPRGEQSVLFRGKPTTATAERMA